MLPDCCLCCRITKYQGTPEDFCKPEHFMTVKMVGKCPEFHPNVPQMHFSAAYRQALEKYKLGYENESS